MTKTRTAEKIREDVMALFSLSLESQNTTGELTPDQKRAYVTVSSRLANDAPGLLSEIERLRGEIEGLNAELDDADEAHGKSMCDAWKDRQNMQRLLDDAIS